jgi:hypothetical protein
VWLVSLCLLGLLGWRSLQQVPIWQDTQTVFAHALRHNPQSTWSLCMLGQHAMEHGQTAEAIAFYREALAHPHTPEAVRWRLRHNIYGCSPSDGVQGILVRRIRPMVRRSWWGAGVGISHWGYSSIRGTKDVPLTALRNFCSR